MNEKLIRIFAIEETLSGICTDHCNMVDECPVGCDCYYIMQIRDIIENIRDDDTEDGAEQA